VINNAKRSYQVTALKDVLILWRSGFRSCREQCMRARIMEEDVCGDLDESGSRQRPWDIPLLYDYVLISLGTSTIIITTTPINTTLLLLLLENLLQSTNHMMDPSNVIAFTY
jgi:hypothetical protein